MKRFREYLVTEATERGMPRDRAEEKAAEAASSLQEAAAWADRVIAGYLTAIDPR